MKRVLRILAALWAALTYAQDAAPLAGVLAGESSAAAAWSPLDLPGLALWLDASDATTITDVGGAVTAWADKSTAGNHAVQVGADSTRPTTGATQNGLNVITFDGGDYLQSAYTTTVAQTAIVVANLTATPGSPFGTRTTAASADRSYIARNGNAAGGVGTQSYATIVTDTLWVQFLIVELSYSGSQVDMYVNGVNEYSAAQSGTGSNARPALIGALNQGAPTIPMTGSIAEVIVVGGRAISADERTAAVSYLAAKWGL